MFRTLGLFTTILLSFFFLSCDKDEDKDDQPIPVNESLVFDSPLQEVQEVLVTLITRTECGACGDWGHPTFDNKIKNHDQINGLALHFKENDIMANDDASAWVDLVGWSATPSFGTGINSQNSNTQNWNASIDASLIQTPVAAVGIIGEGMNTIDIQLNIKFYQDIPEPVSIALYAVEDKFVATQQDYSANPSTVEDYVHNQIFRKSLTSVWGNSLGSNFTAGDSFTENFVYTPGVELGNNRNMKLVAVIFKVDGNGNPVQVLNSRTSAAAILVN